MKPHPYDNLPYTLRLTPLPYFPGNENTDWLFTIA
jgi:hypothetical protein